MEAQCENVAPVIDCTPTHATICSGGGVNGLAGDGGPGGVLAGGADGGGHPPVGAWAPAGMANISANPKTPSSPVQEVRRTVQKDIPHPDRRARRREAALPALQPRGGTQAQLRGHGEIREAAAHSLGGECSRARASCGTRRPPTQSHQTTSHFRNTALGPHRVRSHALATRDTAPQPLKRR
jgi:hypothetical protein